MGSVAMTLPEAETFKLIFDEWPTRLDVLYIPQKANIRYNVICSGLVIGVTFAAAQVSIWKTESAASSQTVVSGRIEYRLNLLVVCLGHAQFRA